jgi:acetolactate synthase-1/2/3 large subunit
VDGAATPARLREIAGMVRAAVAEYEPEAVRLLDTMDRTLPDDANVVVDMCVAGYWLGGYHRVAGPRRFAYPVGWGTLGFGFPAALGTALAGTVPTVCVAGDGGFLFACGELATVAQERIPVTIVLVDDGGYGMLRFDQAQRGGQAIGTDLHTPNFADLARAFGVSAERVDGFGEAFAAALGRAIGSGAPHLIVVSARLKPPLTTSVRWYRRDPQPAV